MADDEGMRLVDLSHPIKSESQSLLSGTHLKRGESHAKFLPARHKAPSITVGTHQGTHVDAMSHFIPDGRSVDQIPLDWFYGTAHVLRLPKEARADITPEDLKPFEEILQPEAKIVIATGWGMEFGTVRFFVEFPSLTEEAAEYLASRRLRMLAMDTPTPSREATRVHEILFAPGVEMVLVQSLANLESLPDQFTFMGFPLNVPGNDGSPVRAVGLVED